MKVTVCPSNQPCYITEVSTIKDLQNLVGGPIAVDPSPSISIMRDQDANFVDANHLVNENGMLLNLPRNHDIPWLVGDVVIAPDGWSDLPYGD